MRGFLYKELVQNKFRLVLTVVIAFCVVFLPLFMIFIDEESVSEKTFMIFVYEGSILRYAMIVLGFFASWITIEWFSAGDRTKKWGYYVASTPHGIEGFVFSKYIFMAFHSALYFAFCILFSYILRFVGDCVGEFDIPALLKLFVALFFIQLVCIAIDFPFSVRFGEKTGGIIKIVMYMFIAIVAILIFLQNPDGVTDFVDKTLTKLLKGDFPSYTKFILAAGSVVLFAVSALISRFLYLTGIEKYSK